jgi:hypothetical protein
MQKQRTPIPPVKLRDFERVFQIVHGVLLSEHGDPTRACLHFGIIGAAILRKYHGLPACPVVGAAGYNLGQHCNDVLCFADVHQVGPQSTIDAFHCWIEVDGWVVDFTAPLFGEMYRASGRLSQVPLKAMQKQLTRATASITGLAELNAFWFQRNQTLETQLLAGFSDKSANMDLVNICSDWYKPTPKPIYPSISVGNQRGEVKEVRLSPTKLGGLW